MLSPSSLPCAAPSQWPGWGPRWPPSAWQRRSGSRCPWKPIPPSVCPSPSQTPRLEGSAPLCSSLCSAQTRLLHVRACAGTASRGPTLTQVSRITELLPALLELGNLTARDWMRHERGAGGREVSLRLSFPACVCGSRTLGGTQDAWPSPLPLCAHVCLPVPHHLAEFAQVHVH